MATDPRCACSVSNSSPLGRVLSVHDVGCYSCFRALPVPQLFFRGRSAGTSGWFLRSFEMVKTLFRSMVSGWLRRVGCRSLVSGNERFKFVSEFGRRECLLLNCKDVAWLARFLTRSFVRIRMHVILRFPCFPASGGAPSVWWLRALVLRG